jgi:putative ABC transport system substrate-binding protein
MAVSASVGAEGVPQVRVGGARARVRSAGAAHALARAAAVATLAAAALAAPRAAGAQPEPRLTWVGYLANEPTPDTSARLRARLGAQGWVDGQTVKVWFRYAQGRLELFPSHAEELVRLGVNVIVASSPPAIEAARQATRAIPIVMATTDDPLAARLVASLERPGGNLTGVTLAVPGLARRRLELLRELAPSAVRVAVLWNPTNATNVAELHETETAARVLGVELVAVPMTAEAERRAALGAVEGARVGGLVVLADVVTVARRAELATFAARNRIPAVYPLPEFVDAGGLAAYGPSWSEAFDRVAVYVDRILRGAAPGELPVERVSRAELHVSLRAARALELPVSPALLARAQRVVQ